MTGMIANKPVFLGSGSQSLQRLKKNLSLLLIKEGIRSS